MASGYGLNGGPSRCYPFWQEVMACYVTNTTAHDQRGAKICAFPLEDYFECLHHKKERRRAEVLQAAYRKAEAKTPTEGMKTKGEIRSLGLLDVPVEEKHLSTFGGWLKPKDPKDR